MTPAHQPPAASLSPRTVRPRRCGCRPDLSGPAGTPGDVSATRRPPLGRNIASKAPRKPTPLFPGPDGALAAVLLGAAMGCGDPSGPPICCSANWRQPPRRHLSASRRLCDPGLAALAWALGAYRFRRYKSGNGQGQDRPPRRPGRPRHEATVEHRRRHYGSPRSDQHTGERPWSRRGRSRRPGHRLGPRRRRPFRCRRRTAGAEFPHDPRRRPRQPRARASSNSIGKTRRPSRCAKITLVGKASPSTPEVSTSSPPRNANHEKGHGGAAVAIALAHMIMAGARCAFEAPHRVGRNSISGDAFRPGDILHSRAGHTSKSANTDAEGRLVLADALALADEARPTASSSSPR